MTTHDDISACHTAARVRGVTGSQRMLLVTLASYPERRVRLTMRELARDLGATVEETARDVAALETGGLLKVWRVVSAGQVAARMVFVLPMAELTTRGTAPSKAPGKARRRA